MRGVGNQQLGVGINASPTAASAPAVTVTGVTVSGHYVTWSFSASILTTGDFTKYVYYGNVGTSAMVSAGTLVVYYAITPASGKAYSVTQQPGSTFAGGGVLTIPQSGTAGGGD